MSSAIVGATSVDQLNENLGAVKFVEKLTKDLLEEIDEVLGNRPKQIPWRFT